MRVASAPAWRSRLGLPVAGAEVARGGLFFGSLWWHLRRSAAPPWPERAAQRRFEWRANDFLELLHQAVYPYPTSPYRQLLAVAGCEPGDLARLVECEGLEGALQELARRGVYVTIDELKGRRPLIRGSARIELPPDWMRNPCARVPSPYATAEGRCALVPLYVALLEDLALDGALAFDPPIGRPWRWSCWSVTGEAAIHTFLRARAAGAEPAHWFIQVPPERPGIQRRYRWGPTGLWLISRLAGAPLPATEHVPITEPIEVARWLVEELKAGRVPYLSTFVSSAVLLCQAAARAGLDLSGARLVVGGEPLTPRRLAVLRASGALIQPTYASSETGWIGIGCLAPDSADDLHLLSDRQAVIRPSRTGFSSSLPANGLLHTVLRSSWPLLALNLSLGDRADLVERRCGCPLDRPGWTTHLREVRNYEKLTAGGMTFFDHEVIRVLDETMPARFGGGPTDYQLLEDEADDGLPRLRLLVHPRLGPLEPSVVEEAFVHAVGQSEGYVDMEEQWRAARWVRVERRAPLMTHRGKIQHLISQSTRLAQAASSETP